MLTLPNRRRHAAIRSRSTRTSRSFALARSRRPLFESLEKRSLLASIPWNEVAELAVPSGLSNAGSAGEHRMVAMEGDTVVVGVRNNDEVAVDAGVAYVYQRDDNGTPGDLGDDNWHLAQTLFGTGTNQQSSDLGTGDFFGDSVAIDGEWMFIGAGHPPRLCCPTPALGDGLGVAYAYRRVGGVWQYQQTLEPVDRGGIGDEFGRFWTIAVEGNLVAISAREDDNVNGMDAGAVHVYRFDGSSWVHDAKLIASDAGPIHLGTSVAVKDGEVIVGANLANGASAQSGAVYVFAEVDGQWQETAKLFASDGQPQDAFGNQVAREGNTIVVGADEADAGGNRSGAVYVFELSGGTWTQTAKLLSSDLEADDHFGRQVDLNNGMLLVGNWYGDGVIPDSGAVYAFERVAGQWTEVDKLFESDRTSGGIGTPSFGTVLESGTSGEVVIGGGTGGGEIYVFAQDPTRVTTAFRNTTATALADRRANKNGVTNSTINVTDASTILDLDVRLDITHPNVSDLSAVLVAPSGTQIPLFAQGGGSGDNFTSTVLDSDAAASIASGTAPFTGRFRPTGNLSALDGLNIQGAWKLVVTDSANGSSGTLQGWSLRVKYLVPVPQVSISDATATEGPDHAQLIDIPISSISSPVAEPRSIIQGPSGDFFVTSSVNNSVLRYDGTALQFKSTFVPSGSGGLAFPVDLVFANGDLLVSSANSGAVLRYNGQTGSYLGQFAPAGTQGMERPTDLLVHDGLLYISDWSGSVFRYDLASGLFVDKFVVGLNDPVGMAFAPDGSFLVGEFAPAGNNAIFRYDGTTGAPLGEFVPEGSGLMSRPAGMKFGPDGALYVVDMDTDRVLRFNGATGAFLDSFVSAGQGGVDGPTRLMFLGNQLLVTSTATNQVLRFGTPWELFTVTLSSPSPMEVTVNYSTAGVTATVGSDFSSASGTITFAPGQTSRTILVETLPDDLVEGNETFFVNLSNAVGAGIADSQGIGIIIDDELPPVPPTKFYVVNDDSPDQTYEYGADGTAVENYTIQSGNTAPRGASSRVEGDLVWVVDANKNVYVYDSSGAAQGSWTAGSLPLDANVQGITTDGTDIWIVDAQGDRVYRYAGAATRSSGSQNAASSFSLNGGNKDASDVVTDGTSIWVLNNTSSSDKVFKYTVGGSSLGSWSITGGGGSPTGITLDPASPSHLWIVDNATERVYQYDAATGRTSGSQAASDSFALATGNTNPQGIADPPVTKALTVMPASDVRITPPTLSANLALANLRPIREATLRPARKLAQPALASAPAAMLEFLTIDHPQIVDEALTDYLREESEDEESDQAKQELETTP